MSNKKIRIKKTYANGDSYEGEVVNNQKNGQGIMTFANGKIYDGHWDNDKIHGCGLMIFSKDESYDGSWVNNIKSGTGIRKSANGDIYIGDYLNDEKNGEGKMIYANGTIFNGTWVKNEPYNGILKFHNKTKQIQNGKSVKSLKPVKPENIKSVPIIDQKSNDCWAHSVSRNFVRTFQILGIIKSIFVQKFYDLFYIILTEYSTCEEGQNITDAMFYLFNYLKKNYNDNIFKIIYENNKCTKLYCTNIGIILDIDKKSKDGIISNLKYLFDHDLLFIGNYTYIVDPNGNNKPSDAIKQMLNYKLQPVITIQFNNYVSEQIITPTDDLPSIKNKKDFNNKCNDDPEHAVNLRKWQQNYIEFKNSWGSFISNEGNFSVTDLKYMICFDDNKLTGKQDNEINFTSLMFDYINFKDSYKIIINKKKNNYYPTFDNSLEIKNNKNYQGQYNMYGLFHGKGKLSSNHEYEGDWVNGLRNGKGNMILNNGNVYEGDWENHMRHGKGKMIYNNGYIYDGDWENDMIHGKGNMIYNDGSKYNGDWENGIMHGKGKMIYNNGDKYDGDWENDMMHGK